MIQVTILTNTKGLNFTYCFVFFKELLVGEIIYLVLEYNNWIE